MYNVFTPQFSFITFSDPIYCLFVKFCLDFPDVIHNFIVSRHGAYAKHHLEKTRVEALNYIKGLS